MTIKINKHRFVVIIEKEIFAKVQEIAAKENRSASNMAAKIIKDYIKQNTKE